MFIVKVIHILLTRSNKTSFLTKINEVLCSRNVWAFGFFNFPIDNNNNKKKLTFVDFLSALGSGPLAYIRHRIAITRLVKEIFYKGIGTSNEFL